MLTIPSPCIGNCRINLKAGLCEGCYRTMDEITAWPKLRDDQRHQVILVVEQRKTKMARPE
ncbi:MAG TPA: DUF1289 domain-containing protein [Methylophilaceae bacterium]|nr:DUF1289 domain-containing protein [Methylophilaceae bacterium]HQR60036.1 DUF1289 domain-containing protein [Methylophilaceae bacterium]